MQEGSRLSFPPGSDHPEKPPQRFVLKATQYRSLT